MSKFSDATLYLAPSGYKEGILFPQKPLSTNGEITFTRASSAWRTNIEGQVEETCYNLLAYSEDFSSGYWLQQNITLTTNTTIAPDGTLTADKLIPNTTSAQHQIFGIVNFLGEGVLSFYAKADGYNFVSLGTGGGVAGGTIFFNLTNGTISGSASGLIPSIQNVGNGWYRCSLYNPTMGTGSNASYWVVARQSESISDYAGNGTAGIFIWGAQLVKGSLPRPYLSTTTRQNFPRVDYSLGTGTFLLEPQRTNIHLTSTSMYNMVPFGATVPTNTRATTLLDPSAGYNAALVTGGSGSSGSWGIYNVIPTVVTSGQVVVVSCYVKAGTHDKIMLQHANVTVTGGAQAYFDLTTGTTPTSGASIQAVGNGWYRCIMQPVTFTADSNIASYNIGCYVTPSTSTNSWSSDFTGKSVYFYGIQVEVGSYATSLISTTSSAVTRIADSFSRGNIFTNNLISASGGTWFVDLKNTVASVRDTFAQSIFIGGNSTGVGGDGFAFTFGGTTANRPLIRKYVGAVESLVGTLTSDNNKVVIKWNGSTADIFVNGTKITSATSFSFTSLQFLGGSGNSAPVFVQQMALWRTPLTDAQCIDLTL